MHIPDEGTIREYYELKKQLEAFSEDVQAVISHPHYALNFLNPGRLLRIKYKDYDFGWGVYVNHKERKNPDLPGHQRYVVDVLLKVPRGTLVPTKTFRDLPAGVRPPEEGEKSVMEVVPVLLSCVSAFGYCRLMLPKELNSPESRMSVARALKETKRRFPDGVPILDPIETMGIKDVKFKSLLRVSIFQHPHTFNKSSTHKITTESGDAGFTTFVEPSA